MARSSFKMEHPSVSPPRVVNPLPLPLPISARSLVPLRVRACACCFFFAIVGSDLRGNSRSESMRARLDRAVVGRIERRQAESARIKEKYPDRIPVIVERAEKTEVPDIDKKKYLVPADLTVGQFVYVVRKRIKLSPEKAIFVFVKNILPPTAAMMSAIYEENKDEDGFLYMTYSGENTFGSL
ncbi:hypothetical protein NL676_000706 [Syzygium grande]|nr:hypothetical protein NL676_000706 [Syzygium grande]